MNDFDPNESIVTITPRHPVTKQIPILPDSFAKLKTLDVNAFSPNLSPEYSERTNLKYLVQTITIGSAPKFNLNNKIIKELVVPPEIGSCKGKVEEIHKQVTTVPERQYKVNAGKLQELKDWLLMEYPIAEFEISEIKMMNLEMAKEVSFKRKNSAKKGEAAIMRLRMDTYDGNSVDEYYDYSELDTATEGLTEQSCKMDFGITPPQPEIKRNLNCN